MIMETSLSVINKIINGLYPDMSEEGRELFFRLLVKRELQKGERLFDEGDRKSVV